MTCKKIYVTNIMCLLWTLGEGGCQIVARPFGCSDTPSALTAHRRIVRIWEGRKSHREDAATRRHLEGPEHFYRQMGLGGPSPQQLGTPADANSVGGLY